MSYVYKLNFVFNCWISRSLLSSATSLTVYFAFTKTEDTKPSANVKQDVLFCVCASLDFLPSHKHIGICHAPARALCVRMNSLVVSSSCFALCLCLSIERQTVVTTTCAMFGFASLISSVFISINNNNNNDRPTINKIRQFLVGRCLCCHQNRARQTNYYIWKFCCSIVLFGFNLNFEFQSPFLRVEFVEVDTKCWLFNL